VGGEVQRPLDVHGVPQFDLDVVGVLVAAHVDAPGAGDLTLGTGSVLGPLLPFQVGEVRELRRHVVLGPFVGKSLLVLVTVEDVGSLHRFLRRGLVTVVLGGFVRRSTRGHGKEQEHRHAAHASHRHSPSVGPPIMQVNMTESPRHTPEGLRYHSFRSLHKISLVSVPNRRSQPEMLPPAVLPPQSPLDCGDRIGTLSATTPEAREASHSWPATTTDSCSNELRSEERGAGEEGRTAPKAAPETRTARQNIHSNELRLEEEWNTARARRK